MVSLMVVLVAPDLTIDILKPDEAFPVFNDFCGLFKFANQLSGVGGLIDGIYTIDFSTQEFCSKVKDGWLFP